MLSWPSCRSPVARRCGFWIIPIIFMEEYSSLMQNLMQIHCSTHSVILYLMVTQYTCSLNSICHPLWLVQWNRHCSHMCISVPSPWPPGYIDVPQIILIILTMTGHFLDRSHQMQRQEVWESRITWLILEKTDFKTRSIAGERVDSS